VRSAGRSFASSAPLSALPLTACTVVVAASCTSYSGLSSATVRVLCVEPCCGGPAPGCGPAEGEACPAGTHEVDGCAFGSDCSPGQLCCEDDACVADPPSCVLPGDVMCEPVAGTRAQNCSDPCFGTLNAGVLSCECA
jgi:hypothetical protein